MKDATSAQERFLARHGESSVDKMWVMNRTLRYHEAVVEVGERVAVYGRARHSNTGGEQGSLLGISSLCMCNTDEGPLVISDRPDAQGA